MAQKEIGVGIKVDGISQSTYQGKFIGASDTIPVIPTDDASDANGIVILYIGTTTGTYIKGKYYQYSDSGWSEYVPTDIKDLGDRVTTVESALDDKVDKVDGKGLSTEDFTSVDKSKLDGIDDGAQVNTIESIEVAGQMGTVSGKKATVDIPDATESVSGLMPSSAVTKLNGIADGATKVIVDENISDSSTNPVQNKSVKAYIDTSSANLQADIAKKVDKVEGMGLSANSYTTDEKNKLAGIEEGAEVNVIESLEVTGSTVSVSNKKATVSIPDASSTQKGLMTAVQSTKLAGIADEATKNIIDSAMSDSSANAVQNSVVKTYIDTKDNTLQANIDGKVDKVTGKALSTNDFTDGLKAKLDGIEDNAQVNKVTDIQVNGTTIVSDKIANLTLGTASNKDIGTSSGQVPVLDSSGKLPNSTLPPLAIAEYKGEVKTKDALTTLSTAENGDIAQVKGDTASNDDGIYFLVGVYSSLDNWIQILGPDSVISVNGKTGAVSLTYSDVDAVPDTRTVNNKALSSDITLNASDVGTYSTSEVDAKETAINNSISTINGQISTISGNVSALQTDVSKKQEKIISASNQSISQSSWISDTSMGEYIYKASVPLSGCTESMIPQVVFSLDQAISADYAPICQSGVDAVYIWSKKNDGISGISVMAIPQ